MTSELVVVAKLCSPVEATVLREQLEDAGIVSYIDNAEVEVTFGQLPVLGGVQIRVAVMDEARARQVIEAARARAQQSLREEKPRTRVPSRRPAWTCLVCGEPGSERMDVCWSCGASREGVPDPAFRNADDVEIEQPQRKGEISGRTFRQGLAVTLIILGTLVFLTDATRHESDWFTVAVWLALWGAAGALWPKWEEAGEEEEG
jgi:hypothetical protein